MKKWFVTVALISACALALAACGGSASTAASSDATASSASSQAASSESVADSAASSQAASSESTAASAQADTAKLDAIVSAIEAVNPVANPRAIDDTSLQYDMNLTPDNIVGYKGDVTNNQDDCSLVFVAQAKDGSADAVKSELEAYQASLAGNNLYAEFADKVAKAKDARIVVKDNYVVLVIAGVSGPDYSAIDTAIEGALA